MEDDTSDSALKGRKAIFDGRNPHPKLMDLVSLTRKRERLIGDAIAIPESKPCLLEQIRDQMG